jgi:molybdopterin-guanine dinucleotide biosynthesis protein A
MWHVDAAVKIEALLDRGERSLRALAMQEWVRLIDAPAEWPAETWTNLNKPEDLEQWRERSPRAGR